MTPCTLLAPFLRNLLPPPSLLKSENRPNTFVRNNDTLSVKPHGVKCQNTLIWITPIVRNLAFKSILSLFYMTIIGCHLLSVSLSHHSHVMASTNKQQLSHKIIILHTSMFWPHRRGFCFSFDKLPSDSIQSTGNVVCISTVKKHALLFYRHHQSSPVDAASNSRTANKM